MEKVEITLFSLAESAQALVGQFFTCVYIYMYICILYYIPVFI